MSAFFIERHVCLDWCFAFLLIAITPPRGQNVESVQNVYEAVAQNYAYMFRSPRRVCMISMKYDLVRALHILFAKRRIHYCPSFSSWISPATPLPAREADHINLNLLWTISEYNRAVHQKLFHPKHWVFSRLSWSFLSDGSFFLYPSHEKMRHAGELPCQKDEWFLAGNARDPSCAPRWDWERVVSLLNKKLL